MKEQSSQLDRWVDAVSSAVESRDRVGVRSAAAILDRALEFPGPLNREVVEHLKGSARRVVGIVDDEERNSALRALRQKVGYVKTVIESTVGVAANAT